MKRSASDSISDSAFKKRKVDEVRSGLEITIPKEILQHILSFCVLDADQRKIRLVCGAWFNIINYSKFDIGAILPSEMNDLVNLFSRCNKPIGLHFRKMDKYQYKLDQVSILSKLTHLTSFGGWLNIKHQDFFDYMTDLQSLEASYVYATTLVHLTKLTTLRIFQIIRSDPTKEKIALRNLTDVELCLFNVNKIAGRSDVLKHLRIMQVDMSRIKNKWTGLESLRSDIIVDDLPTSVTQLILTNDKHWSYTHLTNLKSLFIDSPQCDTIPIEHFPNLEEIVSQSIQHQKKSFFSHLPQLQHLTRLYINLPVDIDLSKLTLTKLRDLSIIDENDTLDMTPFGRLTNLTRLALKCEFRGNEDNNHEWILGLTSLVDLVLHHNYSADGNYNLTPLVNLTRLSFTHRRATKTLFISSLTNMVNLQFTVNMGNTEIIPLDGLTALNNLTLLRFDHQTSYDLWHQIATLTNLLKLVDMKTISEDEDRISLLTGLTKLTSLRVPNINTNATSLMHLTRLQRLEVHHAVDIESIRPCLPYLYPDQDRDSYNFEDAPNGGH